MEEVSLTQSIKKTPNCAKNIEQMPFGKARKMKQSIFFVAKAV
jgi:hypothetical protein